MILRSHRVIIIATIIILILIIGVFKKQITMALSI